MANIEKTNANTNPTATQTDLGQLWEDHVRFEFSTRNTEDTLATMVEDAYVNHIPVLTGGVGYEEPDKKIRRRYHRGRNDSGYKCVRALHCDYTGSHRQYHRVSG